MIQYCYTIPANKYFADNYDHYEDDYYVDEDFNVGNSIRFSKACSGDWYRPGTGYQKSDGSPVYHCDDFPSHFCMWDLSFMLETAVPSPNGYVTVLNCPKCGCTSGENDVITLNQYVGPYGS